MIKKNFRPDLEGIKFFSVLLIVLYNFDVELFNGGFIGVDIFFVLAGFFTTITLLKNYEQNSFSYFKFIENRLRRIFPLLILTILISTLLVLFYQTDREINFFILNALYSITFTSNFLYNSSGTDFFLPLSNYLPLLQTWSISVIFQIYLIFGFFLAIWHPFKLNKKIIFFIFSLCILASFSATQFGANLKFSFPFIENFDRLFFFNQPYWAGFFNLNSRIWEFLLGGIYGLIKYYNYNFFINFKINKFLYNLGFIIISISFFYFSELLPHPSIYILPCLIGIGFIVLNENKNSYLYKFLSNKKIVFLGSLSLSVYLVHYPLIIFFDYFFYLQSKIFLLFVLIIIYFVSFIINQYIEKPFNDINIINRKSFLIFLITTIILIFLSFSFIHFKKLINLDPIKFSYMKKNLSNLDFDNTKYLLERTNYLKERRIRFNEFKEDIEKSKKKFSNTNKKKKILIIGNSHSQDLYLMFETNKNLFENFEFRYFRMHLSNFHKRNALENKKINLFINDNLFKKADIILIASNFRKYGNYSEDLDSIPKIYELVKKYNKKIILSSNAIWFDSNIYPALDLVYRYSHHEDKFINNIDKELFLLIKKNELRKNNTLENISRRLDIPFLNIFDFTCNMQQYECKALDNNNNPLILDATHISLYGAKYYGRVIYDTNWLNLSN